MSDPTTLRVVYASVPAFLDMASEFVAFEQILVTSTEPLEVGQQCRLVVEIPVAGIDLVATGRVSALRPQGALVDIEAWDDGHDRAFWAWVGLCWEILRQAGQTAYQGAAPRPAITPDEASLKALLVASARVPAVSSGRTQVNPGTPGEARSERVGNGGGTQAGGRANPTAPPRVNPVAAGRRGPARGRAPRRPLSARGHVSKTTFVAPKSRYEFTVSLAKRPLPFVLDDIRRKEKTGWLEISGGRVSRRLGFFDGALVQIEQRPHVSVDFLVNAVRAVGLDWRLVNANKERLAYADAPEEFLVSTGKMTQDQAERVLSRRLSVQLARIIEVGRKGKGGFLAEPWPHGRPVLLPDPPVPLVRMIWDGSRAATFRRPKVMVETMRERLLATELRWVGRHDFPLEEATHRVEELDFILRCKEDISSVTSYLAGDGRDDRIALATLWTLLLLGFVEAQESVSGTIEGTDLMSEVRGGARRPTTASPPEIELSWAEPGGPVQGEAPPPSPVAGGPVETAPLVSDRPDRVPGVGGAVSSHDVEQAASSHREMEIARSTVGQETGDERVGVSSAPGLGTHTIGPDEHDNLEKSTGEQSTVSEVSENSPDRDAEIKALIEQRDRMEQLNHFEVLELSWSVHPDDIDPAYFRVVGKYRPAAESEDPQVAKVAQAIVRRIVQAYEVLSAPVARRSYRELLMGDQVEAEVTRLMKEGGLHYLLDRHAEALRCFERAADLAPDRDDVQAELERQRAATPAGEAGGVGGT